MAFEGFIDWKEDGLINTYHITISQKTMSRSIIRVDNYPLLILNLTLTLGNKVNCNNFQIKKEVKKGACQKRSRKHICLIKF